MVCDWPGFIYFLSIVKSPSRAKPKRQRETELQIQRGKNHSNRENKSNE